MNDDDDIIGIFNQAAENAMLYGCGIIKVVSTPTGLLVDVIEPEEYLSASEALKWAAENRSPRTQ